MWLTPHPHAISIDKKMSNLVTVNYNKLVTMEGVSNSITAIIMIPNNPHEEMKSGFGVKHLTRQTI